MTRKTDQISRRVTALQDELNRIPGPAREAEKQLKWQAAVTAFSNGDTKPPDDHVKTQAMWRTLVRYHRAFLDMRQKGLIK